VEFSSIGKLLMVGGAVMFLLGAIFLFGEKIPFLGKLPGDILIRRKGYSLYFPIVTCIVLSLLGSVILSFISRR